MATTSKTDIANRALIRIGAQRIMSIDDDVTKQAVLCKVLYDSSLAEVSRSTPWNCLTKRIELGQLTAAPAFGWGYQYQLPADFLQLVKLNGTYVYEPPINMNLPTPDWVIEGKLLLTNQDTALVEYVALMDDPSLYDPLFTDAFVVLLASKLAVPMRQDDQMATALLSEFERVKMPQARAKNGSQQRKRRFDPTQDSRSINARWHSTRG